MTQTTAAPPPGPAPDGPDEPADGAEPPAGAAASEGADLGATDDAGASSVRIPHAPGLDGLRGLAVAAVLVFHAAPAGWLPGGFLGVSLFFTLSGYLITSLVLAEIRRDRHVAMAGFWARRMRRLVPALVVTTIGVIIAAQFVTFGGDVRADLIGGLTYSANWVQVARDQSYAALFEQPSPLIHLWSLAIEEQFYVVLPIVAWVLARQAPWMARQRLAIGAGVVVVAGVALCQLVDDPTLAYYGTLNRAPEIALGVLLACRTQVTTTRAPRWLTTAGLVALAASAAAWRLAEVTDDWIAGGGLAGFAVISAVLVRAASRPGPVSRLLSIAPLRWLGFISYGLYLYHWPVVVLLDVPRVDLAPVPLFGARVAVSLALAIVSYRLIEQPLRRGRPRTPDRTVILAGLGALVACVILVLALVPGPVEQVETAIPSEPAPAVVAAVPTTAAPEAGEPVVAAPPSVVLIGDSLPAFMLRDGGASLDPDEVTLVNGTLPACDGAAGTPPARSRTGALVPVPEGCTGWPEQYPAFFQADADVAILMVGGHAVLDREIEGEFRGPCDSTAASWYQHDVEDRLTYLEDRAGLVVLALPAWGDTLSQFINPSDYLDRMDCVRRTLRSAAVSTGTQMIDFGRYLCPAARDDCRPLRTKDGIHLDVDAAPAALAWVLDESLALRPPD
jgi:peptidoglycan/LPS O-acetylase OafA/YrhL